MSLLTTVLEKIFLAKTRRSCGTNYKEKDKICLASVYWWVENYFPTEFATICENALNIHLYSWKTFLYKNTLSFLFIWFTKTIMPVRVGAQHALVFIHPY